MIRNIKLYQIHNGCIDYNDERARRLCGSPVLNSQRPESIDIGLKYVNIHFEGNKYSYARPYTIEKVYPAKREQNSKKEVIERNAFRLSFNNPHNDESLFSPIISLSKKQNITFQSYRLFRWLCIKENLLWITNIIVLICSIIVPFLTK